eukprot:UN34513
MSRAYALMTKADEAFEYSQLSKLLAYNLADKDERLKYMVRNSLDLEADAFMLYEDRGGFALKTIEKALLYSKVHKLNQNQHVLLFAKYGSILCKVGNVSRGLQYQIRATQILKNHSLLPHITLPLAHTLLAEKNIHLQLKHFVYHYFYVVPHLEMA